EDDVRQGNTGGYHSKLIGSLFPNTKQASYEQIQAPSVKERPGPPQSHRYGQYATVKRVGLSLTQFGRSAQAAESFPYRVQQCPPRSAAIQSLSGTQTVVLLNATERVDAPSHTLSNRRIKQ